VLGALVVAVTLVVTWALWPREEPLGPGGQPVSAGEQAAVLDFTVARPHWTDDRPGELSFSGDLVVWNETAKERSGLFAADIRIHERFALQKAPAGAVPGSPLLADRLLVWTQGSADAGQDVELWAAQPPRSQPFPLVTTVSQPVDDDDEDKAPAGAVAQATRIKALDATGETVVWIQRVEDPDAPDGVDDRIWLYGVAGRHSRRLDVPAGPKADLAIADGLVVWAARGDSTATTGVWITDTPTGQKIRVAASSATSVDVSGSKVVWSTAAGDIYGFDLRTRRRFTVSTAAGIKTDVQIDGDLVVWVDGRDGRGDIYARDLATDTEMAVSADRAAQTSPRVSGDTVVWLEERSAGWQICGAVVRD